MLAKLEPKLGPKWKNFEVFDKSFLTKHCCRLQDFPVAESIVLWWNTDFQTTIFQCSKNYGSSTRETRLKVVPNGRPDQYETVSNFKATLI